MSAENWGPDPPPFVSKCQHFTYPFPPFLSQCQYLPTKLTDCERAISFINLKPHVALKLQWKNKEI